MYMYICNAMYNLYVKAYMYMYVCMAMLMAYVYVCMYGNGQRTTALYVVDIAATCIACICMDNMDVNIASMDNIGHGCEIIATLAIYIYGQLLSL